MITRLKSWAPTVGKALVALWMVAVLSLLVEIDKSTRHASNEASMAVYYLSLLRQRLAP